MAINSNNQEDVEQDVNMRMSSEVFDCNGLSLAKIGMCSNCTEQTDKNIFQHIYCNAEDQTVPHPHLLFVVLVGRGRP